MTDLERITSKFFTFDIEEEELKDSVQKLMKLFKKEKRSYGDMFGRIDGVGDASKEKEKKSKKKRGGTTVVMAGPPTTFKKDRYDLRKRVLGLRANLLNSLIFCCQLRRCF